MGCVSFRSSFGVPEGWGGIGEKIGSGGSFAGRSVGVRVITCTV